jgi:hypothetical protein
VPQAVHRLRTLVDGVEPEQVLRDDPPLVHRVGEDGVDVALPGEAVAGLGHVPGGVDVRVARARSSSTVTPQSIARPEPARHSTFGLTPVAAT